MAANKRMDIVLGAKDQASKKIGKVKSSLGGLQGSILAAGAAWLSWKAATAVWSATVVAAGEQEAIMTRLKNAVKIAGESYADHALNVKAFLTEMQATTIYGDTDMAKVLQQLTTLVGDFGQATLDASVIAADMAASGLFNLETATRYVGMAMGGNVEMLGRYIPEMKASAGLIDQNMTASEKWAIAQDVLAAKFGGMAAGELNTFQGRLTEMNNALQDAGEALGDILLPALTDIMTSLTPIIKAFSSFIEFIGSDQITNGANDMRKFADAMLDIEGSITMMAEIEEATKEYKTTVAELVGEIEKRGEAENKVYTDLMAAFEGAEIGYLGVTHLQEVLDEKAIEYRETIESIKEAHREKTEAIVEDLEVEEKSLTVIDENIRKRAVALMTFKRKLRLKEIKDQEDAEKAKALATRQFTDRAMGYMDGMQKQLLVGMIEGQSQLKNVFKGMATDFMMLFVSTILRDVKLALVAKLIKMLAFLGPHPEADRMVVNTGRTYARLFQQGVFEGFKSGNFPKSIVAGNLPAGGGAVQIGGAVLAPNVTVIIQGNVIGEDEYVYNRLIPAIEEAVSKKESNLMVD